MALSNLFGQLGLDGTLQKIAQYLEQISSTMGRTYPDTSGRMQVNVITGTIATVSNVGSIGTYNAQYDQYCQMMGNASYIRSRITTS